MRVEMSEIIGLSRDSASESSPPYVVCPGSAATASAAVYRKLVCRVHSP